jgi:hypothetical protein
LPFVLHPYFVRESLPSQGKLPHGEEVEDALFDDGEAVVVLLEDLLGEGEVNAVVGALGPG